MAQLSKQKRKEILEKFKKRSSTSTYSQLEPPKGFDNTKYAGRWVAEHRLNGRSDGFEPRGFAPWKNKEGKQVQVGDLVWCQMDRETAEYRQAVTDEERDNMISAFRDKQSEEVERLNYELGNPKAVTDDINIKE